MSIKIMSMVFDYDMPQLKTDKQEVVSASAAAFVLLALADHGNDEGRSIYPGITRLSAKTKLSKTTVCKALDALELHGYIEYVGRSRLETKEYAINMIKLGMQATGISEKKACKSGKEECKPLGEGMQATGIKSLVKSLVKSPKRSVDQSNEEAGIAYRSIFEYFINECKFKEPKLNSGTFAIAWKHQIEEILDMFDWDAGRAQKCIDKAVKKADKNNLTITTPKSLISTIRSIVGAEARKKSVSVGKEFNPQEVL